jgi:tRNA modification GTPase
VRCEALLVYDIDFPEEDDGPVPGRAIDEAAREVLGRIDGLLETAAEGELLREGALTVIAGRPNAGKSSLFNALCGVERVIVTEEPGTTRDAVEALISLGGYPFRLVDTAGLREATGKVERLGIEVARRYLAGADVVLFCVEAGRRPNDEELDFLTGLEGGVPIVVRTKSDLVESGGCESTPEIDAPQVPASAVTGDGLRGLIDRLVEVAFSGSLALDAEAPIVTRERHARELRRARAEVEAFLEARTSRIAPEVAATHLRAAAHALEELLGVIAPDDLLAHVFSEFCIGK